MRNEFSAIIEQDEQWYEANLEKPIHLLLTATHKVRIILVIPSPMSKFVKIAPDDVAIYFVQRGMKGSVAERLMVTEEGEIPKKI